MSQQKDYGVRVVHAYENKRVGQVIFPPALLRDKLVAARLVERVAPPAPATGLLGGIGDAKSRRRGRRA